MSAAYLAKISPGFDNFPPPKRRIDAITTKVDMYYNILAINTGPNVKVYDFLYIMAHCLQ
jgi:hypothetical protein